MGGQGTKLRWLQHVSFPYPPGQLRRLQEIPTPRTLRNQTLV